MFQFCHGFPGQHVNLLNAVYFIAKELYPKDKMERAILGIEEELKERVRQFKSEDKLIEAQRI